MSCYRSILVALDGSADAEAALRHAVELANDQHARITLLSVVPPAPSPVGAGVSRPPDLTDLHEQILREAVSDLPPNLGVVTRLERGIVAETILRIAQSGEYDLLVMGSHGRSRVRRALRGSVSEHLLHSCPIPVLQMRADKAAGSRSATAQGERAMGANVDLRELERPGGEPG